MSELQKLNVSYGSFSCEIVGFQDPLPVLQDVIGEFRQIAWRYPGFGAQKEDAQRDRLSRLVASKLDAALTANGVAVTLNQDGGGLLVHPVDGAPKGDGWGDLYAKPKPGETPKKSKDKHAAATATAGSAAAATLAAPETAPAEDLPEASEPAEIAETAEPPVETPPAEEVHAAEAFADAAPEPAGEAAPAEPEAAAPEEASAEPVAEPEEPAADPRAEAEAAPEEALAETPAGATEPLEDAQPAAPADAEPETAEDAPEEEGLIEASVREEIEAVVTSEIKDAFAGLHGDTLSEPPAAARADSPKSGLFSRFLGAKKKPEQAAAQEKSAPEAPRPGGRDASVGESRPEEKRPGEAALDATFDAIAKQSGAAAPKSEESGSDDDFVFAAKTADDDAAADPALILSAENAVDPGEAADDFDGSEDRVAKAKAKVMERARERQAAQTAATERRLRIIRRERVEEKSEGMTGAVASAATGAPAMSASDFAKLAGAASLQELMEASAAYATLVGGKHKFTRSDLMEVMSELDKGKTYSSEALIKSFGKMLRTGVLLRVDDGLFAMSQNHRYPYETKIHA